MKTSGKNSPAFTCALVVIEIPSRVITTERRYFESRAT